MKYLIPITNIYHVTEPLMDTANVSSNVINGTNNEVIPGQGNYGAR